MPEGLAPQQPTRIVLYTTEDGRVTVDVVFERETFWLTQKAMAELFGVQVPGINKHLKNIFATGELAREATVSKMEMVRPEGEREVAREIEFYNLDAVIAVGYRINSLKATHFRIWATNTLREFIIKGFVVNDDLLKRGRVFGRDYFDELPKGFARSGPANAGPTRRLRTCSSSAAAITGARARKPNCSTRSSKTNCTSRLPARRLPRSSTTVLIANAPSWG